MNNALNKGVDEGTIVQLVSAGAAPRWRLPPKSASKESLSGKRSTAKQQDKPNKTTVVTPRRGLKVWNCRILQMISHHNFQVLADKVKTSGSRTTKATPPKKTTPAKKTVEKKAKPAMPKKKSPKTAKAKASPKVAAASPMVRATRARSAVKAPTKGKEEVPAKEEKVSRILLLKHS